MMHAFNKRWGEAAGRTGQLPSLGGPASGDSGALAAGKPSSLFKGPSMSRDSQPLLSLIARV
jgi:hypothetical protein